MLQAGTGLDVQLSMAGVEDAPVPGLQNESNSVDNTMEPVLDALIQFSDCWSEEAGDGVRASDAKEEDTKEPNTPLLDEELPDVVEMPYDDAPQVDPAFEVELELHAPSSMPSTPRKSDEPAKISKKLMKRQNKHEHRNRKERSPLTNQ